MTEVHGYNDSSIAELQILKVVAKVTTKKVAPVVAKKASAPVISSAPAPATTAAAAMDAGLQQITTEVVGGLKYLTLTLSKPATPDGLEPIIEVSPDLLDWSSGPKHTTVLTDNARTLRVRDNTPVLPGLKRYIRLKPTAR
ncbi:MAG: hypothetical protein EOP83_35510 [Verrucomicrobiaceae bacterium]|nr:MAG: hypothetical protein EOP83_35510 [Verrucomicrobiaceae bacterium]